MLAHTYIHLGVSLGYTWLLPENKIQSRNAAPTGPWKDFGVCPETEEQAPTFILGVFSNLTDSVLLSKDLRHLQAGCSWLCDTLCFASALLVSVK